MGNSQNIMVSVSLFRVRYYAKNVHQIIQHKGSVQKKILQAQLSVTKKNLPEKSPYSAISWLSSLNL